MWRKIRKLFLVIFLTFWTLTLVWSALAQSGGGYDLSWNTTGGGGGFSSGGSYAVNGTGGQPDAGSPTGGSFLLKSGFWGGVSGGTPTPTPTATVGSSPTPTTTTTPTVTATAVSTATATPTITTTPTNANEYLYLPVFIR